MSSQIDASGVAAALESLLPTFLFGEEDFQARRNRPFGEYMSDLIQGRLESLQEKESAKRTVAGATLTASSCDG